MPKRAPRYFLVVLVDDDFGTFNVLGPMTDDTEITKRAIELRKSGRRVRLTSTQPECELAKTPNPEALRSSSCQRTQASP